MSAVASTTQRILEELVASENAYITGPQLAVKLGVLPGMIQPYLAELRKLGYEIEADPHLGYRLRACPDILLADELKARLAPSVGAAAGLRPAADRQQSPRGGGSHIDSDGRRSETASHIGGSHIGREIFVYKQTNSTSDVIERLGLDDIEEGVVVFAETQSKGRGRRGRTWVSPPGKGLWFSVLLRPRWSPQAVTRITILSAVAIVEALRRVAGIAAEIKWPNDVLVGGKKIAGILTEMETDSDQVRFVTLGIGLNVHAAGFPAELARTATSVEAQCGQPVRRADLAVALLRALDQMYGQAVTGDFTPITQRWGAHSSTLGKRVAIVVGDRRLEGQAMALDENGSLLLRTDNGHTESITGGDVILEQ